MPVYTKTFDELTGGCVIIDIITLCVLQKQEKTNKPYINNGFYLFFLVLFGFSYDA